MTGFQNFMYPVNIYFYSAKLHHIFSRLIFLKLTNNLHPANSRNGVKRWSMGIVAVPLSCYLKTWFILYKYEYLLKYTLLSLICLTRLRCLERKKCGKFVHWSFSYHYLTFVGTTGANLDLLQHYLVLIGSWHLKNVPFRHFFKIMD